MPKPLRHDHAYGPKATQAEAGHGVAEIDFNALWDCAYVLVIKAPGCEPCAPIRTPARSFTIA
jgi:hypothetical protein